MVRDEKITTEGGFTSRIFEKDKKPYEVAPGAELAFI